MTDKEKIRAEIVKLKYQYDKESDRAIRYEHPDVVYQSVHAKYCLCKYILEFIDSLQEEPASNDLEKAASQYPSVIRTISPQWESELENAFKAGAEWKKEQFEKNRIEHCDSITEEQYNLETGFIDYYIDKYNRMPTFLDAIEYGMKKAMEE